MRVPLFIEFSGKNVLVIGGGQVGTKRAKKFAEAGANVVVISKEFTKELEELQSIGKVKLVKMDLTNPSDISNLHNWIIWADLVIYTIPDDSLAFLIKSLCTTYRKLFNDATSVERTDVVIPMEGKVDGIRIAVTTEGKSSVLARVIVNELSRYIDNNLELKNLAEAWFKVKEYLKSNIKDRRLRMVIYYELSNDEKFNEIAKKSPDEAVNYAYSKIKELLLKYR